MNAPADFPQKVIFCGKPERSLGRACPEKSGGGKIPHRNKQKAGEGKNAPNPPKKGQNQAPQRKVAALFLKSNTKSVAAAGLRMLK